MPVRIHVVAIVGQLAVTNPIQPTAIDSVTGCFRNPLCPGDFAVTGDIEYAKLRLALVHLLHHFRHEATNGLPAGKGSEERIDQNRILREEGR